MCGIYAELHASSQSAALNGTDLSFLLSRRGPDEFWTSHRKDVTLANSRLAITCTDRALAESNPTGRSPQVLFNGEIWNHRALVQRFRLPDESSEIDVIRAAYGAEGPGFPALLKGMYAIVLYQPESGQLLAMRDSSGIRPLFYSVTSTSFVVASDLATVAVAHRRFHANPAFATNRAVLGYSDFTDCAAAGVRQLDPRMVLTARLNTYTPKLHLIHSSATVLPTTATSAYTDEAATITAHRGALERSTIRCVEHGDEAITRHGVGLLLSGGIDSSLLALLIARHASRVPIRAFVAGSTDSPDVKWAQVVANHIGLPLTHLRTDLRSLDDTQRLDNLATMSAQPALGLHSVFALMRQEWPLGRIVLTGEGADEIYQGYPWHANPVERAANIAEAAAAISSDKSTRLVNEVVRRLRTAARDPDARGLRRALVSLDQRYSLVERHLVPFDHAAMAHSFEVRLPYLSAGVLAAVCTTHEAFIHRAPQKSILRDLILSLWPDVPTVFMQRSKIGFPQAFQRSQAPAPPRRIIPEQLEELVAKTLKHLETDVRS